MILLREERICLTLRSSREYGHRRQEPVGRRQTAGSRSEQNKRITRLPPASCLLAPVFSTLRIAHTMRISVELRLAQWVWQLMFMARACVFRQFESYLTVQ